MSVSRATTVPGRADEHAQQVELLGGEVQLAVALEGAVRGDVDPDVLRVQLVLVARVSPCVRRSSARTRASSSASRNGLVT